MAAILAVALGLRLWGIGFGLPYEYHVDEVQYVRQAASMGARGLEPVWWNNPPLFKYLLLAEYAGLFGVGRLLGWYGSVADFAAQHVLDPTRLYLLGRATSALVGTLTALAAYWLGRAAYNRSTGMLSAWFLAVCFIHVRDSHYAVNDVAVTFFVTVVLLAAVRIVDTGAKKWYGLAGVALGLGFATKYSAAFALVPLLVGHFLAPDVRARGAPPLQVQRLALALGAACLAAIIASPYFLVTPGKVVRDAYEALYLAGQQGFDGWQIDTVGGYLFHLKSLAWGLGWGLLFLSLTGLVAAAIRHQPKDLVLISLPISMYLVMGRQQMYFARFVLPMVPALLVVAAALPSRLIASLTTSKRTTLAGTLAVALVFTAQPFVSSLRSDYLLTQVDTRTVAKQWIEANIPGGARVALDWRTHGPPLSSEAQTYPQSFATYQVLEVGGSGLAEHPSDWYQEQGYEYLIASSSIYEIALADRSRDAQRRDFYDALSTDLELVQEIRPRASDEALPFIFDEIYGPAVGLWQRVRPGPTVRIYRLEQ